MQINYWANQIQSLAGHVESSQSELYKVANYSNIHDAKHQHSILMFNNKILVYSFGEQNVK